MLPALAILAGVKAINGLNTFFSQRREAKDAERQGDYEAKLYGMNADLADQQAEDAIARGHEAENRQRSRMAQLMGGQRVGFAGQGVDVDAGSARDVVANDQALGELDALTIRNNARREAWGYRAQGAIYRGQGSLVQLGARNRAKALRQASVSTLLTGAADIAETAHRFGS